MLDADVLDELGGAVSLAAKVNLGAVKVAAKANVEGDCALVHVVVQVDVFPSFVPDGESVLRIQRRATKPPPITIAAAIATF